MLSNHRGGYCFELNQYLYYVLRALGYHVTPVMARVVWQRPPETAQRSRTHLINIVTFPATKESPCFHQYICDVAFGPLSYVEPLSVDHDMLGQAQTTKYDTYRIVPYTFTNGEENDILDNYRDHYLVQIFTDKQAWAYMYLFHKRELSTYSDWYGGNWEVATSPESMFVNAILLSIVTEDSNISLFNNELTIRLIKSGDDATSSEVTRKQLNREEVLNVLQEYFKFSVDTEFHANLRIPGIDTISADKN